jgi:hypothetical protein
MASPGNDLDPCGSNEIGKLETFGRRAGQVHLANAGQDWQGQPCISRAQVRCRTSAAESVNAFETARMRNL